MYVADVQGKSSREHTGRSISGGAIPLDSNLAPDMVDRGLDQGLERENVGVGKTKKKTLQKEASAYIYGGERLPLPINDNYV